MKKTLIVTFCFFITLLSHFTATAQDIIHRKNGKTLEAKVLEVGDTEIKYKLFTQPDGPTYVMDATLVKKVVFANGAVHKFDDGGSINNTEYYVGQNKNAYKVSFLSWANGFTTFTYEHSLKPGASYEASLGIIGLGKDGNSAFFSNGSSLKANQFGLFAGAGYKFINKPDFGGPRQRFTHLMHGAYIRPEANFGGFAEDYYRYTSGNFNRTKERRSKTFGSLILSFGKQWVFDNKFLVDFSYGIGAGFASKSASTTTGTSYEYGATSSTKYGTVIAPNNLAGKFTLNIGLLGK